ncbi:glycosyltransferase [Leptolyngbya sp. AN02str]|uniref:glycosyltransferase n=1 Tax=Leptolyngbya sp. AN02str TaxID=3423363 RepID=UPI003D318DAA
MKVLTIHNYYQQFGGEDQIFQTENHLLESRGHTVYRYTIHNDQIRDTHPLTLASNTLWNSKIYQELKQVMREFKPDVAHFHNTFPIISPSAYYAAKAEGVPVVQTLHNYRLLCPNGLFFRDGKVCEDCVQQLIPLSSIIHNCYRNSRTETLGVATMLTLHSFLRTWLDNIEVFIAYSQFALDKFVEGGLPANKFMFKTNFLHPDPGIGAGKGGYALFVGRLSVEKGLGVLLNAWERLNHPIPLKVVGDGPMAHLVRDVAERVPDIEWLGRKSLLEVYELMGNASFLVFPSEWYETFGRVAIEAFACGTPVIAADIGAITELVTPYKTGLHFKASDAQDLAAKVEWAIAHPQELTQMRHNARTEFEAKYTADDNYQRLTEIYQAAITKGQIRQGLLNQQIV